MLHAKNGRAWYAKSRASRHDDRSWHGMTRTKSRSIEVNKTIDIIDYVVYVVYNIYDKTGPFLRYPCLLSTTNIQFEPTKDHFLLVWQRYLCVSYHLRAVALISPVTFDPRGVVDLLSPSLSIMWLRVPGPPAFQHEILKSWEWAQGRG